MKDTFIIKGGKKLEGEVDIQTSKNAILPILSACILTKEEIKLLNYPKISDVLNMIKILKLLNVEILELGDNLKVTAKNVNYKNINESLCKTMRSSVFLLGSVLSRCKHFKLVEPGGCKIGSRPIDIHISALKQLNVKVLKRKEYIYFNSKFAHSNKVKLRFPSVGATENIIQFACLLKGKTQIFNAAREPEVVDLCNFLNSMGAKISGAGTRKITIYGVDKLSGVEYKPIGDRIVCGTILTAVAVCGGKVTLKNVNSSHNKILIKKLVKMGCKINSKNDIIKIESDGKVKSVSKICTGCYPKFPTDLQSFMLVAACVGNKKTIIFEKIFENRFLIVPELKKIGAKIDVLDKHKVCVYGVKELHGNDVYALDLRGGASLTLAGLVAKGETIVHNVHFIDRGYVDLEVMLLKLGAEIKRI